MIKNGELITRTIKSAVVAGGSSRNGHLDSEINGRHLATVSDDFRCQQYTFDVLFGVMQEAIERLMFLDPFRNFYMASFTPNKIDASGKFCFSVSQRHNNAFGKIYTM